MLRYLGLRPSPQPKLVFCQLLRQSFTETVPQKVTKTLDVTRIDG